MRKPRIAPAAAGDSRYAPAGAGDRPSFARDFPRVRELDVLVEAFARGDYARVRVEAEALATSATEEPVRNAARTLAARTTPDPLSIWLLVLAGALWLALSAYWIGHGKPPEGAAPRSAPVSSPARSTPAAT